MQLFVLQNFSCCTESSVFITFSAKSSVVPFCMSRADLSLGSMSEIFPLLHFAHMLYFISNAGKNRLIRHCKFNVCVNGVCIWWWDGDLCPGCIQEQVAFNRSMHVKNTQISLFIYTLVYLVYTYSVYSISFQIIHKHNLCECMCTEFYSIIWCVWNWLLELWLVS